MEFFQNYRHTKKEAQNINQSLDIEEILFLIIYL